MIDYEEHDTDEGSMTVSTELPIATLVLDRSRMLGLSRSDVVRRAGFKNVAKGVRRLDDLCSGDTKATASLIRGLPAALNLPTEIIDIAVRQTQRQIEDAARIAQQERDAKWRADFQPSAYLLGTETRPTQITIFGMTGGSERWLRIPLDLTKPALTFASQALAVARRIPRIPFFGPTIGYVVNYTTDCAVRFDLNGDPVQQLDRAYSPGNVAVLMGGREVSVEILARIMPLVPESGR
jgi:hypothetical protein